MTLHNGLFLKSWNCSIIWYWKSFQNDHNNSDFLKNHYMRCSVFSTIRETKGSSIHLPIFKILKASVVYALVYAFYGCLKDMPEKCSIISYLLLICIILNEIVHCNTEIHKGSCQSQLIRVWVRYAVIFKAETQMSPSDALHARNMIILQI